MVDKVQQIVYHLYAFATGATKLKLNSKSREATTDHDDDRAEQTGAGHTDHGTNPTTIHALRPSSLSQKIRMVEKKRAIRDV